MGANLQAFQAELSRARQVQRGSIFRGTASFACENTRCAVGIVRTGFVEEAGAPSLPFQWPLHCPRCRLTFVTYIGLEIER